MQYIVANFKSHKTEEEAKMWLERFSNFEITGEKTVIICPPFTLLPIFKNFIEQNSLPLLLGSQNVSAFDEGPYTGEESAKQIKEFADYVLIGHSERRTNFNESEETLSQKCEIAIKYDLMPIYLVQSEENIIPQGINLVAYEPVFAIGSGNPDTPENADRVAQSLKDKGSYQVLYGGSVTADNVKSLTSTPNISGVLVGGASLMAEEFINIIKNA